jgi:IS605 OrfB family transposase
MITLKLNITTDNDKIIMKKQKNYSFAFRKLYINYNKINDNSFLNYIKNEYNLSVYELNCLLIDIKTKINQVNTEKDNIENNIITIQNELLKNNLKTKIKFKLNKKLSLLNKQLSKNITFGSKKLLQKISFLSNNKFKNEKELIKIKEQYKNKRLLPIYLVGSKNDSNSNRYFNFYFINNSIIYKPSSGYKVNISYKVTKNYQKLLLKLQVIKEEKLLPITVSLTTKYIFLTFDEEILNGYSFDDKNYFKELKLINKNNTEKRKELYIKYKNEQKEKKLKDKIKNRYLAFDLNPQYIGISVCDKKSDGYNIIHKEYFDLSLLSQKLGLSSDDDKVIKQGSKRKYEISCLWKYIFGKAKHYKCGYIVMEDLNFKPKVINQESKEFNRKVKNIWLLNYQKNLINKYCQREGYILVEVNPIYSSFIGNIENGYVDPVSSSIEICRRGMVKYDKGGRIIPLLTSTNVDTMIELFLNNSLDVQLLKDCKQWNEYYYIFNKTKCKYRCGLSQREIPFSLYNIKSMIKHYCL